MRGVSDEMVIYKNVINGGDFVILDPCWEGYDWEDIVFECHGEEFFHIGVVIDS